MKKNFPRILITGTNSGCGKTTVTCGLLQALINRGVKTASFKCGPDYIDPMFHSRVIGRPCRNLDLHFFDGEMLRYLLARHSRESDISVIEGVMGYYDGSGTGTEASSYDVAKESKTPAVLVVNARGAAHSLLAVIYGFVNLHPDGGIKGVIFNNCSAAVYTGLAEALEEMSGGAVKALGYMPKMPDCAFESRHLGLITADEVADIRAKLNALAAQAEKTVDIDGLIALASSAGELEVPEPNLPEKGEKVRVGVVMDKAFCFYYEDNLSLLRDLGAEIVEFSTIDDPKLPEGLDGIYIGGGYPELHTRELAANESMRSQILEFLKEGKPFIAECGGFMYLHDSIQGEPMVGYLPGDCFNNGRLTRFGYVTVKAHRDGLFTACGDSFRAHEFHYWDVSDPGSDFTAEKPSGKTWECGFTNENLYAGFPHFHFYSKPDMAQRFLTACRREKHRND